MSAIVINAVSFSDVSEIAIVPDSECRMPTLIGPVPASAACTNGLARERECAGHRTELQQTATFHRDPLVVLDMRAVKASANE